MFQSDPRKRLLVSSFLFFFLYGFLLLRHKYFYVVDLFSSPFSYSELTSPNSSSYVFPYLFMSWQQVICISLVGLGLLLCQSAFSQAAFYSANVPQPWRLSSTTLILSQIFLLLGVIGHLGQSYFSLLLCGSLFLQVSMLISYVVLIISTTTL